MFIFKVYYAITKLTKSTIVKACGIILLFGKLLICGLFNFLN